MVETHRALLRPELWDTPLAQIARATGLTISLYDREFNRTSGPHAYSPLAQRLRENGFWDKHGLGDLFDRDLAAKSKASDQFEFSTALQSLGVVGFPVHLNEKLLGYFILGWNPVQFADPVVSDYIAKQAGLPQMEIWQLIRMQPPMAREKIILYSQMVQTFAQSLIEQLQIQALDREQARVLKIINESGIELTGAMTDKDICDIGLEAIKKLVDATFVRISIVHGDSAREISKFETVDHLDDRSHFRTEQNIEIPIRAEDYAPLGTIEIKRVADGDASELSPELSALAAQIAVALQKSKLLHDIQLERHALSNANDELRHLHRLKDEFLATVSHELRTPLNAMLGWAQMLRDDDIDPEDFKNAVSTIERNALIQSKLIEDLLDVSRIISGKMTLKREILNVVPILQSAVDTVRPIAESRGHKLHIELPLTPVYVKADATRLQQIFWNILSNSVKFTEDPGHIWVILESSGPYFKVEISDNGRGIPPEFLPQLFDRFSQADGSHSRRHGGLGLGLAIVRHLIELHGGSISAKSEGEGKGSKFSIILPQELGSADFTKEYTDKIENSVESKVLSGIKVLAVDDQPDSLYLLKKILERSGAAVHAVSSAREGYEEVLEWRPDLIVSDISMPDEDGYDFIRRVRELATNAGGATPAFALTAHASAEATELAMQAGFQKHFTKPINSKLLLNSVEEFSSLHRN